MLVVEFKDAFALFDKKGDNKIDVSQIGDVMRALNLNPSEADVKKIIQEVDPSGRWGCGPSSRRVCGHSSRWECGPSSRRGCGPSSRRVCGHSSRWGCGPFW